MKEKHLQPSEQASAPHDPLPSVPHTLWQRIAAFGITVCVFPWRVVQTNTAFLLFMYALGILSALLTLPPWKGAELYERLFPELFFDLFIIAALLTLLPRKVQWALRALLYIIMYGLALVDTYCFNAFGATINPSMLLLVGETDGREVSSFLQSFFTPSLLFSPVGWVLLLILIHAGKALLPGWIRRKGGLRSAFLERFRTRAVRYTQVIGRHKHYIKPAIGLFLFGLVWHCGHTAMPNKEGMARLFSANSIGQVEHLLTRQGIAKLYEPPYRLAFSIYANELASQQLDILLRHSEHVQVDSCAFNAPNIVLIIGESYGKHHSGLYGYPLPTTPRQAALQRSGRLITFTDVVAPWNLTSYVFKNVFSSHVVGEPGDWCDAPLFPQVFRQAGYKVTFLTNQFLPKAKQEVYDFSGGFFLNHPELSAKQFDLRNTDLHVFDAGLLADYDALYKARRLGLGTGADSTQLRHNLVMFHLIGQHVSYRIRCPNKQKKFTTATYEKLRPDLDKQQKQILADYDNAVLYNDSIVSEIVHRFAKQNAIVIYMPDHGEECYEGNRGFICRKHSAKIDYDLARYEFEIPFWVWCSRKFVESRPDLFAQIKQARKRPFMTDALPHLLYALAGISSPYFKPQYSVIDSAYNAHRPRLLKGTTDYNLLKTEAEAARKAKRHTAPSTR